MGRKDNLARIREAAERRKHSKRRDKRLGTDEGAPTPWEREIARPHDQHYRPVFACQRCIDRAFPPRTFDIVAHER